ncbi:MAG: carbamoyltransferase HypF [Desulfobacterota bacterium]|nr:carbamoyltransferase HypF [Thermodesulfobacteriota bacterium]
MKRRVRCLVQGTVQGVGFRPFVYRTARSCHLAGFVCNSRSGVIIEVEGEDTDIERFLELLRMDAPPRSEITDITLHEQEPFGEHAFRIVQSYMAGVTEAHCPPDTALCEACRDELLRPGDRRFRYPFITCSICGPRLTIVRDIPYDRANTAMSCFPLCAQCAAEYTDPADRRFHAETIACPVCGPQLALYDATGAPVVCTDPLAETLRHLRHGAIVAVKGLGGFHLCVDAANDAAVRRLRSRKCREEKPFAIMVNDIAQAEALAELDDAERDLLRSPERPIVLVRKKSANHLSDAVAPGMATLGIMLPYTPLQHLLLENDFIALVMTSGNRTDEPICIGNREAIKRLNGIADFFLVHNRDILVRCDDSIAMSAAGAPYILRRARGFVPKPISVDGSFPPVLALGPHLKATVCILKNDQAFVSQHLGDMDTPQARDFFHESIELLRHITQCTPDIIAHDMHPGYYSTRVALEMGGRLRIAVQHHHAHIVSCMAENRINRPVIGIAMDGTGYGDDGMVWGGEFLVADASGYRRAGHIAYFKLPGGAQAVREPWRCAAGLLREAYGSRWIEKAVRLGLVPEKSAGLLIEKSMEQGINAPLTSSLGRVFDAVAALLGVRQRTSFEGQAAMELEAVAAGCDDTEVAVPFDIREHEGVFLLDLRSTVAALCEYRCAGTAPAMLAKAFHQMLCRACTAMAERIRAATGIASVVLSGGCFQNKQLLEGCSAALQRSGFSVAVHRLVPPNDGGIALGQAVIAGIRACGTGREERTSFCIERHKL